MRITTKAVGDLTWVKMVPKNNMERTFLHTLANQLPGPKTRKPEDKVYVSDTDYGVSGLISITLTSTERVTEW